MKLKSDISVRRRDEKVLEAGGGAAPHAPLIAEEKHLGYSTCSSAKMRNSSLKSEFIGILSFHADPVIGNEFPGCLETRGAPRLLPLLNSIGADLVEGSELGLGPM